MYNRTTLNMAEIKSVDDIRGLFGVDASFVNLDNQFYEMYAEDQNELPPFDQVIADTDWEENLDNTIYQLGQRLMRFDDDFIYFDFKIIEKDDTKIVSVVFTISQI